MSAKYKLNGVYYEVKEIDEDRGIIFLLVGHESFPVALCDIEDIG